MPARSSWTDAGGLSVRRGGNLRETGDRAAISDQLQRRLAIGIVLVYGLVFERWRVPPGSLQAEITETVLMTDRVRAVAVLASLRRLGVRVALDGFGTGYSSLAHLRQLPLDEIEIDRSFVLGIAGDGESASILRTISDLGHLLGLQTVADGHAVATEPVSLAVFLGQAWRYRGTITAEASLPVLAHRFQLTVDCATGYQTVPVTMGVKSGAMVE